MIPFTRLHLRGRCRAALTTPHQRHNACVREQRPEADDEQRVGFDGNGSCIDMRPHNSCLLHNKIKKQEMSIHGRQTAYGVVLSRWAMSLEAGEGDWSHDFSFFSVTIQLTDVGQEHMEDTVGLLFRYIKLLQTSKTPKWIFDEIFPPEDWLIASSVPSKFSPDAIQNILNELTPETVRIFWESKNFGGQTYLTEPWYGTSYSVKAVPPSIIQKWV